MQTSNSQPKLLTDVVFRLYEVKHDYAMIVGMKTFCYTLCIHKVFHLNVFANVTDAKRVYKTFYHKTNKRIIFSLVFVSSKACMVCNGEVHEASVDLYEDSNIQRF